MPQKSRAAEWDELRSAAQILQCLREAMRARASAEDPDIFRSAASEIPWRGPLDRSMALTRSAQRAANDIRAHLVRDRPLAEWNEFRSLEKKSNCCG